MPKHQHNKQYEVGYKKPPKHGQFKKGQSGNPRGRPKKKDSEMPDARLALARVLNEQVAVKDNDKVRSLSKIELVMRQVVDKAAAGDFRPMRLLFPALFKTSEAAGANDAEQRNGPNQEDIKKELDELLSAATDIAPSPAPRGSEAPNSGEPSRL